MTPSLLCMTRHGVRIIQQGGNDWTVKERKKKGQYEVIESYTDTILTILSVN